MSQTMIISMYILSDYILIIFSRMQWEYGIEIEHLIEPIHFDVARCRRATQLDVGAMCVQLVYNAIAAQTRLYYQLVYNTI